MGIIAQELREVFPEAVSERSGYLMVDANPVFWAMVNAIQEQQEQIEKLTEENGELHREMQTLWQRLDEVDRLNVELAEIKAMLEMKAVTPVVTKDIADKE